MLSLRRRSVVYLVLLSSLGAVASAGGVDAATAFDGFDRQVEAWMKEWKVPGLGVAVVQDGEVVLARGYGYRDLEGKVPVTENTLFAIGSNTKSFTVTALGMLATEGLLKWEKPVREYMPDFRLHDPHATALMTARDLVSHRSGLPRHDLLWLATGLSREELFARLCYLEPSAAFGSRYQYQNLMFMSAGILAERLTGQSWEQVIEERVFAPLGMERSNLSVDDMAKDDDFSYAYFHEKDGEPRRIPFRNIDAVGPAGSINSSAAEMAHYVQFHIDLGKWQGKQVLDEKSARAMQSPQMPITGPQLQSFFSGADEGVLGDPSYGLGLMISSYRGRKHVRHGGGIDGFISSMEWLPHERIGVVALSNTNGSATVPGLVVRAVFDRLLGLEPIDWAQRARDAEAKSRAEEVAAKKKAEETRHPNTSPSHALGDYVGEYEHPAYGTTKVSLADGGLRVAVVGFEWPLEHYHYDVFRVPEGLEGRNAGFAGLPVTFRYDRSGSIERLEIPLERAVSDIVFERVEAGEG